MAIPTPLASGPSLRFAGYGVLLGTAIAFPTGLWVGASDFMMPSFYRMWLEDPDMIDRKAATLAPSLPTVEETFDLRGLTVARAMIESGGPPKDGIPALTDPDTVGSVAVDFLDPDDRIVSVTHGSATRAYPIRLLNWHEIVNDTLDGTPIAVIYCPLCDSVSVVDRRLGDETLAFGVSGLLFESNILMYDRVHHGLWSQVLMSAISGPHAGRSLEHLPFEITTFAEWREHHPTGTTVTFDTGHRRNYHVNPYLAFIETDRMLHPPSREDRRLAPKERVIGVRTPTVTKAYRVSDVLSADDGRLLDLIDGERLVLEGSVETGRVAVIERPSDAQVMHVFWYSWAATHPGTAIHGR